MMRIRPVVFVCALAAVALAASSASAADFEALRAQGAQAVLANSDKLTNEYPTQVWTFEMTVKPKGGESKSLEFQVWQKTTSKRLIRFLAPGEVKGMSILNKGKSIMYVYSPQTDNVRRVAAHARRQRLLGSNLTYGDMAGVAFAEDYEASFEKDEGDYAWLELKPKEDSEWTKLRVRVDKKTTMVDTIQYFDGDKHVRTQARTKFEMLDGVPTYRRVTMTDEGDGFQTVLDMKAQKVGEKLADGMFKKRALVRGD